MKQKTALALGFCVLLGACGGSASSPSSDSGGSSSGAISSGSTGGSGSPGGGSSSGSISLPGGSSGEAVGGSSSSGGISSSSSGQPIQAGTLTAGDYDDLLNFNLYQNYISDFLQNPRGQVDIPYVDVGNKILIDITDVEGSPVFGAKVSVQAEQAELLQLTTPVNGRVHIYPTFDDLPESFDLLVTTADGLITHTETVITAELTSPSVEVALNANNSAPTELDIALVLDTTGSMGDEIRYLQAELTQIFKDLQVAYPNLALQAGLIAYKDVGDIYVTAPYPFTDNLLQFETDLNSLSAGGGGDYPEAVDQAMVAAMELAWRPASVKILLLVADAPPHEQKIAATWAPVNAARAKQIHIVPVAASDAANTAEFLMRSMAAITNSRYVFLTDDSGVGNAHAEPSIDCYVVTRLDASIQRIIKSLVTGVRVEPQAQEIVRTAGNYNQGVCDASGEVDTEVDDDPSAAEPLASTALAP